MSSHSHYLKCLVNVSYSYTNVSFNTQISTKIIDETHISFNDIIEGLSKQISLDNFAISYCEYDNRTNTFVNLGKYPLDKLILIGYNNSTNNNSITYI